MLALSKILMSSRRQQPGAFREYILAGNREEARNHLFRALYGVPAEVQIGLARRMTARFLPIFRANHPEDTLEATWPETVLDDLDGYHDEHERTVENEPANSFGGDMSFRFALYALLDAVSYSRQGNLARVTPACCTALLAAVSARAANVWHADDPEGVQAWHDGDYEALAGRGEHDNVASVAVTRREWLIVADWLEEHQVGDYPEADEAEREQWFEWWQERECQL